MEFFSKTLSGSSDELFMWILVSQKLWVQEQATVIGSDLKRYLVSWFLYVTLGFVFWKHLWVWVLMCHSPLPGISQVLATLQKNAEAAGSTAPFPLHSQYVPSVLAGRVDGEDGSDDGDGEKKLKPKPKSSSQKKIPKSHLPKKTGQLESKSAGWCYNSIRTKFMDKLRSDGKSFVEASELWDQSMEKARSLFSTLFSDGA